MILDLDMPMVDGYEACQRIIDLIRHMNLESNRNQVSIQLGGSREINQPIMVALSAFVDEAIKEKCLQSGFMVVLQQPLTQKDIKE